MASKSKTAKKSSAPKKSAPPKAAPKKFAKAEAKAPKAIAKASPKVVEKSAIKVSPKSEPKTGAKSILKSVDKPTSKFTEKTGGKAAAKAAVPAAKPKWSSKPARPPKPVRGTGPAPRKYSEAPRTTPVIDVTQRATPEKKKNDRSSIPRSAAQNDAMKRRSKASEAMREALEESSTEASEDEEFDPAAFFAASGGSGEFRAHVMRKERVDLNVPVRYRFPSGPLVFNAELINLSKGGLALKTSDVVKAKTVLRIEIPLPHTSELFAVQAEVVWSGEVTTSDGEKVTHTGLRFLQMSLAKQAVINQFIQQRRDEVIMAKIGLDKFTDSVPVAGLD